MNLTLFFRLILMSIFQSQVTYNKTNYKSEKMSYDNQLFYCPVVWAKDGFNVSLQIHNENYCSSENGYRQFGHTIEKVEFGFPSKNESMLHEYAEGYYSSEDVLFDVTGSVGSIPVPVLEQIFKKHGGIDWKKTISVDTFELLTKGA